MTTPRPEQTIHEPFHPSRSGVEQRPTTEQRMALSYYEQMSAAARVPGLEQRLEQFRQLLVESRLRLGGMDPLSLRIDVALGRVTEPVVGTAPTRDEPLLGQLPDLHADCQQVLAAVPLDEDHDLVWERLPNGTHAWLRADLTRERRP